MLRRLASLPHSSFGQIALFGLVSATTGLAGCYWGKERPEERETRQELEVMGEVLDANGNPKANTAIDNYKLTLVVDNGHEVQLSYNQDDDSSTNGIVTDQDGRFRITEPDIKLKYTWTQDEYLCWHSCADWDTTCQWVDQTVCETYCEDVVVEECWDDCWQECSSVCYDETYCDDFGCWTETVCYDDCATYCDPVCSWVTTQDCWDECWAETVEECTDTCVRSVETCDWVTNTYSDVATFDEIVSTRAEITFRDAEGVEQTVEGSVLTSKQVSLCKDDTERNGRSEKQCDATRWLEHDRFTLP